MRSIVYATTADRDLRDLFDRIADDRGEMVAEKYIERIKKACDGLLTFPLQGAPRSDIGEGLRAIAIDRRALVIYMVSATDIEIVRILYGGRDLRGAFSDRS